MEGKKFSVGYVLNSDLRSLTTVTLIPCPAFGEAEGKYSYEEALTVSNFISKYDVPQFSDNVDRWSEFRDKLNKEIYNIYDK